MKANVGRRPEIGAVCRLFLNAATSREEQSRVACRAEVVVQFVKDASGNVAGNAGVIIQEEVGFADIANVKDAVAGETVGVSEGEAGSDEEGDRVSVDVVETGTFEARAGIR